MSGHKRATVVISEDEYRRLHEAEMNLRFMPARSPEPTILDHQVNGAILDHLDHVRERQRQFDRTVTGFTHQIQMLEQSTSQRILDQQSWFSSQISEAVGSLSKRTQSLLNEQANRFDALLAEERQARSYEFEQVNRQINDLVSNYEHKQELADEWIQAAEGLDRFICENYFIEAFTPGQVERLERDLQRAINNLADGVPEAALVTAQSVYSKFSDLRIELEQKENEWQTLYQACWEAACQLLEVTVASRECHAHDLDGQELPVPIDVDHWSFGEYCQALEGVEAIVQHLQVDSLSTQELKNLLEDEIVTARQRVEDAIYHARLAVLNSQLRINIADLVVEALGKQGFVLQQAEYARDDQRMAYSAKVRNLEGNEIVIQVNPDEGIGQNELHLVSLDRAQRTEHELRQRSNEISRSLSAHGLQIDGLRPVGSERKQNRGKTHQNIRSSQTFNGQR